MRELILSNMNTAINMHWKPGTYTFCGIKSGILHGKMFNETNAVIKSISIRVKDISTSSVKADYENEIVTLVKKTGETVKITGCEAHLCRRLSGEVVEMSDDDIELFHEQKKVMLNDALCIEEMILEEMHKRQ